MGEITRPDISIVRFSALESTCRIDAEYYLPRYLELDASLAGSSVCSWSDLGGQFIVGPFGSAFKAGNYVDDPVYRYIRGRDVKRFFLLDDDSVYVPEADFFRLRKHQVQVGDLLVSVVGTLGNVAIVTEDVGKAIYSCKSTLYRPPGAVDPYYLCAYLNSAVGQAHLERNQRGALQMGLNLDDLCGIPICVPPPDKQRAIGDLVREAYEQRQESKRLYREAEQLLLDELGWSTLELSGVSYGEGSLTEAFTAGYLNSEYFEDQYKRVDELVASYRYGVRNIGETIAEIVNGAEFREYVDSDGVPYLRVTDMTQGVHISPDSVCLIPRIQADFLPEKKHLERNDVLLSRSGTLGLASVVTPEWENAVISSHIMRLVRRDDEFAPFFLAVFLSSKVGKRLLLRRNNGSVVPEINHPSLEMINIPRVPNSIQQKLVRMVQASHDQVNRTRDLLEQANRKVEAMIESEVACG